MASDVMFVNGLPFVVSISIKLIFVMAEHMPNRIREILLNSIYRLFIYKPSVILRSSH